MSIKICVASVALAFSIAGPQVSSERQFGSIEGAVLDGAGNPILGAKVYDEPLDSARIGKEHFVVTDQQGRFVLRDVPVGKTMIIATKTEEGYPDARFAVYSGNEVLPVVDLKANQTMPDVVVKLLAKGGLLRGRIVDSVSGLPVPKSRITISRVDHPEWSLETDPATDGSFEFLVPCRQIDFRVAAQGYKPWAYEKPRFSRNHEPLTLTSGATRSIDVDLEPIRQ